MKIIIPHPRENAVSLMRRAGYIFKGRKMVNRVLSGRLPDQDIHVSMPISKPRAGIFS
jgi:hypothetical protein